MIIKEFLIKENPKLSGTWEAKTGENATDHSASSPDFKIGSDLGNYLQSGDFTSKKLTFGVSAILNYTPLYPN